MILTDKEIEALWTGTNTPSQGGISRAIEAAVIAKLSLGADMPEPVAYAGRTQAGKWKYTTGSIGSAKTWLLYQEREYLAKGLQIVPLYTADQLRTVAAAARLKALEEAEQKCIEIGKRRASNSPFDCADTIRALKGTT